MVKSLCLAMRLLSSIVRTPEGSLLVATGFNPWEIWVEYSSVPQVIPNRSVSFFGTPLMPSMISPANYLFRDWRLSAPEDHVVQFSSNDFIQN
jgi:hypothetical protein